MQTFTCPICDFHIYKKAIPYRALSTAFLNKSLVNCSQCKTWSIYPYPDSDNLSIYYNRSYWSPEVIKARESDLMEQAKSRYDFFSPYLAKDLRMKVLDVGSALGLIQEIFRKKHDGIRMNYHAIEINPEAVAYLKNTIGSVNIFQSFEEAEKNYSIIIISHLLEHFQNPRVFLEEVARRLNDKGIVFIEVPNEDFRWKTWHEPHTVYFNKKNLSKIVNQAGYEILTVNTCGPLLYNVGGYKANFWELIQRYSSAGIRRFQSLYKGKSALPLDMKGYDEYGGHRRWIRLIARISSSK
jgi:SAM-dependent methyltransferase